MFKTTRIISCSGPALGAVLLSAAFGAAADYETPPTARVDDLFEQTLIQGEHHRVQQAVTSDGYLNYYTIDSDFGQFEAVGGVMLRERVVEIDALAELDELSNSEVFVKAAADAGVDHIVAIGRAATRPVSTVRGIPGGIGRMFGGAKRTTKEAAKTTKEAVSSDENDADEATDGEQESEGTAAKTVGLTERYLGVTSAEREWSKRLGTDPYSSNDTLQSAIKRVARVGWLGSKLTPTSLLGLGLYAQVSDLIWNKSAYELRELNHERLIATGAAEELIEAYLDHAILSPTQQTLLTAAIGQMEDVPGRDGILVRAIETENETEARFYVQSVAMLAAYHVNRAPFSRIAAEAAVPAGIVGDSTKVFVFAVDRVYWTESVALAIDSFERVGGEGITEKEIGFLGTASERVREELSGGGWRVAEEVALEPTQADGR